MISKKSISIARSRRVSKKPLTTAAQLIVCAGIAFVALLCYVNFRFVPEVSIHQEDVNTRPKFDNVNIGQPIKPKPRAVENNKQNQTTNARSFPSQTTDPNNNDNPYPLPKWVSDYINWHRAMRSKYPGKSLIEDPSAPKLLVRTCLGICGGLHDRLGQLPMDLYLASQTNRVLLIKWIKPQPLEEFLVPPDFGIDWRFPTDAEGWGTGCRTLNDCAKQVRAQPKMPSNVVNRDKDSLSQSFESFIDEAIKLVTEGELKESKAVTFTILGHLEEDFLENRLRASGETDMIHNTPTFGHIFRTFFKPHPNVQAQIDTVDREMGLVTGKYTIAHCRVRHPKAYKSGESFNGQFISNADKTGLPFEGIYKDLSVGIANRAIQCAATLPNVQNDPIYFMSDSSDLVKYLAFNLTDPDYISKHPNWFQEEKSANVTAKELVSRYKVVARDQSIQNAHIDKNKGRPAEAYYATFVDLFIGINARCVSFGIGYYALFAAKISGTKCKIRYAKEEWGESEHEIKQETAMCAL